MICLYCRVHVSVWLHVNSNETVKYVLTLFPDDNSS